MSDLAKRLLTAQFSGYPAHGSGFVTILSAYEPGANIKDDLAAAHDRIEALEAQNAELFEMVKRAALIIPQHQENWHCDFYTMTHEASK